MPGGADIAGSVVSAGANIAGGLLASGKVAKGFKQAGQIIGQEFERSRESLQPFSGVGTSALDQLALSLGLPTSTGETPDGRDFSEFFKSPGFQFRLDEGVKAVERSAASRGLLQSGAGIKAVQRFGEGLASSEFNNYFNQLFSLSEQGRAATTTVAGLGANAAAGQADAALGRQQARASGFLNVAQNIGGLASAGGILGTQGGAETFQPISVPQVPTTPDFSF